MPAIERNDGVVIAWGGTVEGPKTDYSATGAVKTVCDYTTQIGLGGADLRNVTVRLTYAAYKEAKDAFAATDDELRSFAAWYLDRRMRTGRVPVDKEYFVVQQGEIPDLIGRFRSEQLTANR